jgi:MFS family permease
MEKRNIGVLCLICFFYNVGISTTLAPIMAGLQERACTDREMEPACTQPPISDKGATDEGLANAGTFFLLVGASNFATIAAVGELSDAKGRRCALLIALTGQLLSSITWLFIFSATSLPVFFTLQVGCFLSGGQFAIYGTIFASLADLLKDESVERRTMFFGAMTGVLYAGLVVGPLLIGALTTQVSDVAPLLPRVLLLCEHVVLVGLCGSHVDHAARAIRLPRSTTMLALSNPLSITKIPPQAHAKDTAFTHGQKCARTTPSSPTYRPHTPCAKPADQLRV